MRFSGFGKHNQRAPAARGKPDWWHDCAMSSAMPPAMPAPRRRHSRLPVLGLVALVLAVHAWLLGGVAARHGASPAPATADGPTGPRPPAMLQTRVLVAEPAAAVVMPARARSAAAAEHPAPAAATPATVRVAAAAQPAIVQTAAAAQPAAVHEAPAAPPPVKMLVAAAPTADVQAAAAASTAVAPPVHAETGATTAPAEGAVVPIYSTRMPPPARLTYDLRRGIARGTGELLWAPANSAYKLQMQGNALGMALIGWDSQGGFDGAGIAPVRFVDSRRGRDAQAANFRRDSGRITFSGPAVELALAPGTQDRLSWMLQLPAIIEADPKRFQPGAHIAMWVVGARGEMSVWSFAIEAREAIDVPAGMVAGALHLRREPRKPYDTLVEIWLDPARHHLPAKVRMSIPQTGDMTEFSLQEARFP